MCKAGAAATAHICELAAGLCRISLLLSGCVDALSKQQQPLKGVSSSQTRSFPAQPPPNETESKSPIPILPSRRTVSSSQPRLASHPLLVIFPKHLSIPNQLSVEVTSSTMSSSAASTPSKAGRSKYANDEERKAAARERQRIYAARKRAEAKEAKLRALDGSSELADTSMASIIMETPHKSPKKAAVTATGVDVLDNNGVAATGPTPKKRGPAKKKELESATPAPAPVAVVANGVNTHHESLKSDDQDTIVTSHSFSFSDDLTVSDFLPAHHIHSDHILVPPQPTPSSQLQSFTSSGGPLQDYAVIHIPGNPGLISYYSTYLPSLSYQLSESYIPSSRFTVFGASLGGFDVRKKSKESSVDSYKVFSLKDQIDRQVEIIEQLLVSHPSVKIILTGHSVGSFILLEALRILKENGNGDRIIGGIGLFPTITHISRSSSGRKAKPIITLPGWLPTFTFLAEIIIAIIPAMVWGWLIALFMRRFDKPARETTVKFLKSPVGIRQGLYMAKDEMLGINEDVWDETIWGSEAVPSNTELVFYFGGKDHWVFNEERDKLITRRGRGGVAHSEDGEDVLVTDGWKPKMIVCEEGVPHSYCITHSDLMASKTAKWVEDIVIHDRSKHGGSF